MLLECLDAARTDTVNDTSVRSLSTGSLLKDTFEEKLKMLTTSGDGVKLRFPGESGSGQHQAQCVGDTY